jgi:hypothetical protein
MSDIIARLSESFSLLPAAMERATSSARFGMIEGRRYNRTSYVDKNFKPCAATTTYVGTFVRKYRMGSGDGMTYHTEFKSDDGKTVSFVEEYWGNLTDIPATYTQID